MIHAHAGAKWSIFLCKHRTNSRLHDLASPRRKLRAPSFDAQTKKPACPMVLRPKSSIFAWPPRDLLDGRVSNLRQVSDASVSLDSTDAVFIRPCILNLQCTKWIAHDSKSGVLRSHISNLLMFIFYHLWSIGTNLSLDLHHIYRPPHRILRLHITSQETSNSHNAD